MRLSECDVNPDHCRIYRKVGLILIYALKHDTSIHVVYGHSGVSFHDVEDLVRFAEAIQEIAKESNRLCDRYGKLPLMTPLALKR